MKRSELWYNCGVETTRPILYGVADYAAQCGFDAEKAYDTAIRWYDNYRFGSASAPSVANTTLVLSLFSYLWRTKQFPKEFMRLRREGRMARFCWSPLLDREGELRGA